MHDDVSEAVEASYKRNEPEVAVLAADETPAAVLSRLTLRLRRRWLASFDDLSETLANYFATEVKSRVDRHLMAEMRKAGFTVRFRMTSAMKDAFDAVRAENVGLIKSIPEEYFTQVEGLVMRSVSAGRDLSIVAKGLEKRLGITKRRAALIARDQNNKATAVMRRARELQLGIEEGIWLHSAGGKVPRPPHVAFSGKRFNLRKGHDFGDGNGAVLPGEPINCRCTWKSVIPGFDD